ncbi:MAG: CinA family nicotinamide mononucleotide deamidase-related protein [Desulfuromonadales bacterium]
MEIGVLTIGSELLNGEIADTNTWRIANVLAAHGFDLRESLTVADSERDIAEALIALGSRREVVIVTGGLGPTDDDLTARAAAQAFGRRLVLHETALRQVQDFFRRAGREMHPRNEKQALLPQKAIVLPNPVGSAPGFLLQANARSLFFLPGVPEEMLAMLGASVLPQLEERAGGSSPRCERVFKTFDLPEPEVEERLAAAGLPSTVQVAFGVEFPFVYSKFRAEGGDAEKILDLAEVKVRRALGSHLVAIGAETLAGNVANLLTGAGLTLALAESCTGGLIAAQLTDIPGASAFLERGAVTYANSAKTAWLGVSTAILEGEGAVSEACARAMARGIRQAAGSDLGLAVTGIAGPSGGTAQKPVGTVFLALSAADAEHVQRYRFGGDRGQIRQMAACMGLDWLRRYLATKLENEAIDG